jgi:hypothetical protein
LPFHDDTLDVIGDLLFPPAAIKANASAADGPNDTELPEPRAIFVCAKQTPYFFATPFSQQVPLFLATIQSIIVKRSPPQEIISAAASLATRCVEKGSLHADSGDPSSNNGDESCD